MASFDGLRRDGRTTEMRGLIRRSGSTEPEMMPSQKEHLSHVKITESITRTHYSRTKIIAFLFTIAIVWSHTYRGSSDSVRRLALGFSLTLFGICALLWGWSQWTLWRKTQPGRPYFSDNRISLVITIVAVAAAVFAGILDVYEYNNT